MGFEGSERVMGIYFNTVCIQKKLMNNNKTVASKVTKEYLPLTLNTKPQV